MAAKPDSVTHVIFPNTTLKQEAAKGPAEPPIKPAKHEDVVFEVSEDDLQKVRRTGRFVGFCWVFWGVYKWVCGMCGCGWLARLHMAGAGLPHAIRR